MIKLPKEIKNVLLTLQSKDYFAYVYGKALKDIVLRKEPKVWTILTDAKTGRLAEIVPESKTLPVQITCFDGTIDDYFQETYMRADAVVFDGNNFLDPDGGLRDIEKEIIKTLYDPDELFQDDPLRMFDMILAAADTNFDIDLKLCKSIIKNSALLDKVDKRLLTERFVQLLTSPHTGKGLRMLDGCSLLPHIVGEKLYKARSKKEINAFKLYCENIDGTQKIADRRIVSFYLGFFDHRDIKAMNNLPFSPDVKEKLVFAHEHLSDIQYIKNPIQLKGFLYKYGLEAYEFLISITKVQSKVYQFDAQKIINLHMAIQEIGAKNEPVFREDLAMNAETLIKENLAKDQDAANKLLDMLIYIVHRHPDYNNPVRLLSQAYRLNKSILKRINTRAGANRF